jgi:hypothetical protein
MIENDNQMKRTEALMEGFRQALAQARREMSWKRLAAVAGSYQGIIQQLDDELRAHEDWKRGE